MNRTGRWIISALAAAFASVIAVPAQSPTDFSGVWEMKLDVSATPTWEEEPGPVTVRISQSETQLIKRIQRREGTREFTYRFDGVETIHGGGTAITRAEWRGPNLHTHTVWRVAGMAMTTEEVHSLSADGGELVIEARLVVQHGYAGTGGRDYNRSSARDYYARVE